MLSETLQQLKHIVEEESIKLMNPENLIQILNVLKDLELRLLLSSSIIFLLSCSALLCLHDAVDAGYTNIMGIAYDVLISDMFFTG